MPLRIKDVALAAGVSVTTVSRVLSNNGPVRDSVRARVQAAIQQLGYRPNAAARRLRSGDTATIGLLVSDVRNPFFTEVSRAVEDEAYRHGMRVILCNTDENAEKEAMYVRLMEEERVTGMIYSPTGEAAEHFRDHDLPFPVVMIDRAGPQSHTDAVTLNNADAAAMLVEHLVEQGHSTIFAVFCRASTTGQERKAGYEQAMARRGLKADYVFVEPHAEDARVALAARLQAPGALPHAILAGNGPLLLGAYRALRDAAIRLPNDIALTGFDNDAWTDLVEPGITVAAQPVYEIGRHAMDLLLQRLADPNRERQTVTLPATLLVRGSTRGVSSGVSSDSREARPTARPRLRQLN